jgi:hypothetical protein
VRSRSMARLIFVPPVIGLALIATACGSSGTPAASGSSAAVSAPPPSSSAPAPPASTPASSSTGGSASATSQIKTNWESFFSGSTSAATKISLLQNGQTFGPVITAQVKAGGLAASASAVVTAVVVESASTATVSYNVDIGGTAALSNQTGTAVYQDGVWKVGDISFCKLLTLENGGKAPAVCSASS